MKKWIVVLALMAAIVAIGTVGVLGLTVVNQSRENSTLQKQLNAAREETRVARELARETQKDIARLLKRQRQLTNFIRDLGSEPPPVAQGGQSGPSPNPGPEECLAEVLGVCV